MKKKWIHPDDIPKTIVFCLLMVLLIIMLLVPAFNKVVYEVDNLYAVTISSLSGMLFAFYSNTIIGVDRPTKKQEENNMPGQTQINWLCIFIGIIVAGIFGILGVFFSLPEMFTEPHYESWIPLFYFYLLEFIGVVFGPMLGDFFSQKTHERAESG